MHWIRVERKPALRYGLATASPEPTLPAIHDRGGLPTEKPIDRESHEWADWEHLANALVGVLRRQDLLNVDELRRGIEAMSPEEYESCSYYERWSAAIELLLVEKGVLTVDEIAEEAKRVESRWRG